jgi:hypothetical protein
MNKGISLILINKSNNLSNLFCCFSEIIDAGLKIKYGILDLLDSFLTILSAYSFDFEYSFKVFFFELT